MDAALPRPRHAGQDAARTEYGLGYYLPALALVLAGLAIRFASGGAPLFPVDDAYITAHNAQALHWGHDPSFSGTSALAGATSPFHLLIVAALMYAMPVLYALEAAAWLGAAALALGIAHLCRVKAVPPTAACLLIAAALLAGRTPHQLLNGLETGWAMAGVAWALSLVSEQRPARQAIFGGVCGLLPALRPELAALTLLLLPLPALRTWYSATRTEGRSRAGAFQKALSSLAVCVLAAAAAAAPWLLWEMVATGSPVPATIDAKKLYFAEAGLDTATKWIWIRVSLVQFGLCCGPLTLGALALPFTSAGRAALLFTGALLAAYYVNFPGALGHYEGRYLYVLVPVLAYGAASLLPLLNRWPLAARWMPVFLLAAAFRSALTAPYLWREHREAQQFTRVELAGVANWCTRRLPPGSRLLIHDAGYISFGTRFRLFDIVGLKTPENIAFHRQLTFPSQGKRRGAAIDAIALRAEPDYLVVLESWDGIYGITDGLRRSGWRLEPLRTGGKYIVYRMSRGGRHGTAATEAGFTRR